MKNKNLFLADIPIIMGVIIAEYIVFSKKGNLTMDNIGVIVALIGVAGTLTAHFFQFKKDSNKISEVKSDTSNMLPKVDNIAEKTTDIRGYIADDIKPSLQTIVSKQEINNATNLQVSSDIREVLEDVKYRKRLSEEYNGMLNRDTMISGIDEIYSTNAALKNKIKELREKERELSIKLRSTEQKLDETIEQKVLLQQKLAEYEKNTEREIKRDIDDDFEL